MYIHPIPQDDDSDPTKTYKKPCAPYASFQCDKCLHIHSAVLTPIFIDLPPCPLCSGKSWLYAILAA